MKRKLLATSKCAVMFLFALILSLGKSNDSIAQTAQISISGKVKDTQGNPIPGASISVKGTTQVVASDANGNFKISAQKGESLVITFVGYVTNTILVANDTQLSIILAEDKDKNLQDVVVIGYGTQKRSDVTGSIVSVPKARLSQLPVTNVLQSIEGAVAGVNVSTTSSVPGSQPNALIRGQNSISATTGPYVVVDGVPLTKTGGSLNDINPNDIASVEVLKDASATAIYGTNGSNGVILITTKRGTTGKPVIRYSGYAGIDNIAHILQPGSGADYVQKYADMLKQTGQVQQRPVPNIGELPAYNAGTTTDWVKEATQQGVIQDHNVSISGGSQDVKYFISGDYLNQKGVIKGYDFKRIGLRSNLDVNVTSFLTIGTSLFLTSNNFDGGRANLLLATAMSPYGQEYNTNGTYTIYPMSPEQLYTNPLLGLTTTQIRRTTNINGNGYAEVKFPGVLTGLKFRLNAGYTYFPERRGSYIGRLANDLNGTASSFNASTNSYTIENILSYSKDIKKHHFDFTALYSAQERQYSSTTAGSVGFINDELGMNNMGAGATQTSGSYRDRYGLNSQMGRLFYSYDSKYLLTLTARRDGSSVFGANTTKYGVFPSAAIGWNIINEDFMKSAKFFNNLKLRLSYGKTGNEAVDVNRTITTEGSLRSPFNGISTIGVAPNNLGNASLQWETTKTANIGLDFGILNNRINGSIEAYQNKTSGLLLNRALPIITGYSRVLENIGKTTNKGLEITLNTQNIAGKDFRWETMFVFATNKNKITNLYGDGKDDLGNRWFIGKPIRVVYDYQMTGVWQTGEDVSKQDPTAKPGSLKFADLTSDGKITADDRTILGQIDPKWTGGLTNTFHYKNINLSIFIQTAQGMTRNNTDLGYGDETGRRNTPAEIGYWTPENMSQTRPALSYNNTLGYGYASDASYTRIKDVTLSYVFAQSVLDKLHLGSLTVYASGRNLHTFTKWVGWDPEQTTYSRGSGDGNANQQAFAADWTNNYPLTRTFVLGLNVSLR
ncbi:MULTISPECIES: TonB-dependent receptor [unclassified Pedobacter]|uniref:SusC/RagA family TonB-linked outer membrane protein n=1 Tax=unclassified Pedobacter TaxID=2628915 RepID=UPI001E0339F5|nr:MULTISPECIES: TonB-dependent receptor [unclassified Pedobacter]CAH0123949.1 TonB-dependent receptor SusC [Pedobacter sp. Bi36]CAH0176561.1 TonB-dependent receptor SusC [Pedobacter sp. Bi126]